MELVAIAALCNAEDDYCRTDASLLWLLLLILLLPPLVLAEREGEREGALWVKREQQPPWKELRVHRTAGCT